MGSDVQDSFQGSALTLCCRPAPCRRSRVLERPAPALGPRSCAELAERQDEPAWRLPTVPTARAEAPPTAR